jgi:hypothetical protein
MRGNRKSRTLALQARSGRAAPGRRRGTGGGVPVSMTSGSCGPGWRWRGRRHRYRKGRVLEFSVRHGGVSARRIRIRRAGAGSVAPRTRSPPPAADDWFRFARSSRRATAGGLWRQPAGPAGGASMGPAVRMTGRFRPVGRCGGRGCVGPPTRAVDQQRREGSPPLPRPVWSKSLPTRAGLSGDRPLWVPAWKKYDLRLRFRRTACPFRATWDSSLPAYEH